ncbi:amidohydrolase family protein [Thiohalobacter sp. IOR34]|uniref:amidohydrolase family protein n=1 Tax=Thiohalobacter sp. IOR34 TaxID=3057176 RepID=UPI0025B23A76|nr:amidohydrolase family protein [Thiohalobacter sp. IOR34]WJW76813.1 amidohydrolase family protein [Thiohalobacter sp. IOR34]
MRFRGWRRLLLPWLARNAAVQGSGADAARAYMDRMAGYLRAARHVRRAVLLALDRAYDAQGVPSSRLDGFTVSNGDVRAWCNEDPELFLFGASVHPHRQDALDALQRVADQGAVLVKLIPNSQGIDLADPRHRPYLRKLNELRLPLLCHTGIEIVLPTQWQAWGDLDRLRPALDAGVTVIAAHGGSSGWFHDRPSLRRYAALLAAYPNLYGDTAALGLVNRMGTLLWWRDHAGDFGRLLFGTDYPLPLSVPAWRPFLAAADYRRLKRTGNPFDRMVLLLEALQIRPPEDGFEVLLRCLGRSE